MPVVVSHQLLEECSRLVLVNTGTSPEAVASAVVRLVEHLGSVDCVVLATTRESRGKAREAAELASGALHGSPRFFLDVDAVGVSLYSGLPVRVSEAVRGIEEFVKKYGGRLLVVDVTGGIKLEAVLATIIAALSVKIGGKPVISYTPGQAFARPSQLRSGVRGSGWWARQWYPRTPRPLQTLLLLRLSKLSEPIASNCNPSRLQPPSGIGVEPVDNPETLHNALGEVARLLNSLTCSKIRVKVGGGDGEKTVVEADWSEPKISWVAGEIEDPDRLTQGKAAEVLSPLLPSPQERAMRGCLSALVKMAAHEPMVVGAAPESVYGRYGGRRLSEVLIDGKNDGASLDVLVDTSVLLSGLLNSILAAEVRAALEAVKPAGNVGMTVHNCVLMETRKYYEYAKPRFGTVNPCSALALVADLHYAASRLPSEGGEACYCDPALLLHAESTGRRLIASGDAGIVNMLRIRSSTGYLHVKPTPLWRGVAEEKSEVAKHRAAASIAQLILYLALATPAPNGGEASAAKVIVEGDHASAALHATGLGKLVVDPL